MQWTKQKLTNVASFFEDGNWIESKDQSPSGYWLVQTGNIGVISFRDKETKRFVSEETFRRLRCTEIYAGDILISRLPDPVGRACIVLQTDYRMLTAVDCTILRLKKDYDTRYINHLLNSKTSKTQVYKMVTGSSRKRISRKNLGKIEIPIPFKNNKPDLAEQKRIVDKLDKVFAETEKGASIASKEKMQTTSLKKSLLVKVFSDPELQKVKLGNYFDITWGNTSITKKSYVPNGYTAYSAAGADGLLEHYEHESKGIILSAIGARCGKCFLADGKWTAIKNTIVITSKPDCFVDEKYAWYFLNDEEKWRSKGAGQPFITQARAIGMELPVPLKDNKPDLTEQKRIVEKLDAAFALSEQLGNLFVKQGVSFSNLRTSVLNEAFSLEMKATPIPVPEQAIAAPRPFYIQQAVALILKRFERGEMVVAKMLYLAQSIYQVPLGIQFSAQNFGPYDTAVKKAVTAGLSSRNKFFAKKGSGNTQVLSLGPNANKILKYANSLLARKMNSYLDEVMFYFSNRDSSSIERLATICKIIEDTKTTDEKIIKEKLHKWKPNKFQDAEVSHTIAFVKKNKWDAKLIT